MSDQRVDLERLSKEEYCYLTTRGRVSGHPHEIEIWFGVMDGRLYLLSGGGYESDWMKNLMKDSHVSVRIAKQTFSGSARIVEDKKEELKARRLLAGKYEGWKQGEPLSEWAQTAVVVGIKLAASQK